MIKPMTNIGSRIFAIGCEAAKTLAGITDEPAGTGCPVCGTNRARRVGLHIYFDEGIIHDYKPDKYGGQFDLGNYICENGHQFSVDDEGKITNQ
jgi:hypothetical protein